MNRKRGLAIGFTVIGFGLGAYKSREKEISFNTISKRKILVLGAGYAGRSFIKNIDTSKFDVIIIDKAIGTESSFLKNIISRQFILFQPQPNYVDAILEGEIVSQRMMVPNNVKTIKSECISLDPKGNRVVLQSNEIIDYDFLVLATGSIPDTFNVKMNYSDLNHNWYFFKEVDDVKSVMRALKISEGVNVVIMGGGITGVELASEIGRQFYKKGKGSITILEAGGRLLPKLDYSTSQVITDYLGLQENIQVFTSATIKSVSDGKITIVDKDNKEVQFNSSIGIWTCGVKPDPMIAKQLGHNKVSGQLRVLRNDELVSSNSNIFAIGDCNNLLPKSAQHAKQQGAYLAKLFNNNFKENSDFNFNSKGIIIRLSDRIYLDSPIVSGFLPLAIHRLMIWLDL